MRLPIYEIREQVLKVLAEGNRLVLSAPTGSGKTTQVPKFILELRLKERGIIVLQPRRIAARMVAKRVAEEMSVELGGLVGYQTRHDSRVSARTILRFMTEGLFLRLLQSNATLRGVGAVVLDEFHERNLATDVSAALVKRLQESTRPDLRAVVMSATLDVQKVAAYLSSPALEAHGRAHPVDIRYLDKRPVRKAIIGQWRRGGEALPIWEQAADALGDVLDADPSKDAGDVLIFMPGAYEIRRTIGACEGLARDHQLNLLPLYSELPPREQDAALSSSERRKVIVSTNVAETSITIPGVRHVIDSGLARVNRFDAKRGINVLAVEPISQASAEQRAGRAGRTAPGTAMRLWLEREHRHRPAHETPEVKRLDLAEVILQLKSLGVSDIAAFPWLEPPEPAAVEQAMRTLVELDALTQNGDLTETGASMATLPMHPRLSRMLIEVAARGKLERGALWAALVSERDILQGDAKHSFADELPQGPRSDFVVLERALEYARSVNFDPQRCTARGLNANACRELDKTHRLYLDAARNLAVRLRPSPQPSPGVPGEGERSGASREAESLAELAKALLCAFPDHLATRRNETNLACALAGNRRGQLDPSTVARRVGLLLPVEVREIGAGNSSKTVLSMVSEIDVEWLREMEGPRLRRQTVTLYDADLQAAQTLERELFHDLVIAESPRHEPDRAAAAELLAQKVLDGTLKLESWDDAVDQWIARVRCVAEWFPQRQMITYDDQERRLIIEELCAGAIRYKDIKDKPVIPYVKDVLSWDDQQFVEKMAPPHNQLPRGWRMKIEYTPGQPPRGRAKIQDFYDLNETPTVAGGRQKVLLEILGPNLRPVQLTDDLHGFWQRLYPQIRSDLKRRYPRHDWR